MNLDYKRALDRARKIIDDQGVSYNEKRNLISIFPELGYTHEQEAMSDLLEFLEEILHFGKNAKFDKYDKADATNWINIINDHFFATED